MIFAANSMDRERASAARTLQQLQKRFGREVLPIQLPIGEEARFSGVVDLVRGKAYTFPADESGAMQEVPVPAELKDEAAAARNAIIEMVAEQDEALLEKFFAEGTLADDELVAGLTQSGGGAQALPARLLLGRAQPGGAAPHGRARRAGPQPVGVADRR